MQNRPPTVVALDLGGVGRHVPLAEETMWYIFPSGIVRRLVAEERRRRGDASLGHGAVSVAAGAVAHENNRTP